MSLLHYVPAATIQEMQNANVLTVLVACADSARAAALVADLVRAAHGGIAAWSTAMADAVERVARVQPDVLLLAAPAAGDAASAEMIPRIALASPRTSVLVLWHECSSNALAALVRLGAAGCLIGGSASQVQGAVRDLARDAANDSDQLTMREREILALIGDGLTNKEIARRLAISDHTVKTHLHHVYVKLEKSGRYKAYLSQSLQHLTQ